MNVAKKRTNIIPIIEDARHPHKYRMLVSESSHMCTHTNAHTHTQEERERIFLLQM